MIVSRACISLKELFQHAKRLSHMQDPRRLEAVILYDELISLHHLHFRC